MKYYWILALVLLPVQVLGQTWTGIPSWTTQIDETGAPTGWQDEPGIPLVADPVTGQPTGVWQYVLPATSVEPYWFRFRATDGTNTVGPSNVILVPREWTIELVRRPGPDGNTVELVPMMRPRIVEPPADAKKEVPKTIPFRPAKR